MINIEKSVLVASLLSFLLLFTSFSTTYFLSPAKAQHLGPGNIDQATGCIKDDFKAPPAERIPSKGTMDQSILSQLRRTNPEWVPVDHSDPQVVAEGTVYSSWIAENDILLDHNGHDKDFDLLLDNHYANLASISPPDHIDPNHLDPNIANPNNSADHSNAVEVEWDTGSSLYSFNVPTDYWPSEGDKAWTMGRWVYDCGHNFGSLDKPLYTTEIHPASATAFSHTEPVIFPGMHTPSIATVTHLYIHGHGGYYDTPVPATIDKHYRFDIPLPPRPCFAISSCQTMPHAEVLKKDFNALNVPPPTLTISGGVVHVDYDLSSATPSPDNKYGVVIASGWLTPQTTQDYYILKASVTGININNCQGCNNWSMWADIGTHWVYLGTFKSSAPDVKVGDCFNQVHCTPAGFIPLRPVPAYVTFILPTKPVPSSPSSPISASSLLFAVQGYSWSNNEDKFGLFPSPDPFSNTDVSGNEQKYLEYQKRINVGEWDLYYKGSGYRGHSGKDAILQFIADNTAGMKVENIFCHFGSEPIPQYGPFGIGNHIGLVSSPTCATSSISNTSPLKTSNYTISYTIQGMGTIPKGTPTGWIPPIPPGTTEACKLANPPAFCHPIGPSNTSHGAAAHPTHNPPSNITSHSAMVQPKNSPFRK